MTLPPSPIYSRWMRTQLHAAANLFIQSTLTIVQEAMLASFKDAGISAAPKPKRGRPVKTAPTPTPKRRQRKPKDAKPVSELGNKVLSLLAAGEPRRAEDIKGSIGIDAKELKPVLKALVSGHMLKTSGKARATTYALSGKANGAAEAT